MKIGSRSDPDPEKLDLDPDRGSWIGDPVHHCEIQNASGDELWPPHIGTGKVLE